MFPSWRSVSVHSRLAPQGKYPLVWNLRNEAECSPYFFFFLLFFYVKPCALPSQFSFSSSSSSLLPTGFQGPGAEAAQRSLTPSVRQSVGGGNVTPGEAELSSSFIMPARVRLFCRLSPLCCLLRLHAGELAPLRTVKQQRGGVGGGPGRQGAPLKSVSSPH